jgi:hypothetical protein
MSKKKKSINVTVLVADSHKQNMSGVVKDLKEKGFVLKDSLEAVGVVTGSVAAESVSRLSKVPGVSAVEEDRNDYHTQTT